MKKIINFNVGLILVFIILRVVFFLILRPWDNTLHKIVYTAGDSSIYHELAVNVLQGNGYQTNLKPGANSQRTPVYPLFLAGSYGIFNYSVSGVLILQLALNLFTVYFIYLSTKKLFDKDTALVSAVLFGVNLVGITFALNILTETVFTFLVSVFLLTFIDLTGDHSIKNGRFAKWIGFGFLIGILTLTRPIAKFLIMPVLVSLLTFVRPVKNNLRLIAAFLLGYVLLISPWIFFNYYHHNHASFSSQQGDAAIWGASLVYMSENEDISVRKTAQDLILGDSLTGVSNPFEASTIKEKIALNYITAHPIAYLKFFTLNFLRLLVVIPLNTHVVFNLESPRAFTALSNDWQRLQSYVLSAVLLSQSIFEFLAFVLGSVLALKNKEKNRVTIIVLLFIILYFIATAAMFDGTPRYRLPVVPVMEMFGAYGIISALAYLKKSKPGEHFDSSETLIFQREIIQKKKALKEIYDYFYSLLLSNSADIPAGTKLELGSGGGYLKEVIPELVTSDILPVAGIDKTICAEKLPFGTEELSVIYMTNTLHHIKNVEEFLTSAEHCLKRGAKVVMVEPANTPFSNFVYRYFHHENFDTRAASWSLSSEGPMTGANGALPWIVFVRDKDTFTKKYPSLNIKKISYICPFSYLLSGGMSKGQIFPNLLFPLIIKVENCCPFINRFFGMFMLVVLQKRT